MPKRTITTRRNKADAATPVADATPDNIDTTPAELAAVDALLSGDTDSLTITGIDGTEYTITTDADGLATTTIVTPDATPVATPVATPDAKAAFLERKALATTSAVSLYPGASLAVHRSDRQPADSKYLERVASPVQKIGPNGPTARDNSFILAVYDYLATYFGGDYSVGFNPANFGADLGTTSRAASVGYLALTDDKADIVLTPAGITRGANLAAKRAKA
jgi:hypothetical protein